MKVNFLLLFLPLILGVLGTSCQPKPPKGQTLITLKPMNAPALSAAEQAQLKQLLEARVKALVDWPPTVESTPEDHFHLTVPGQHLQEGMGLMFTMPSRLAMVETVPYLESYPRLDSLNRWLRQRSPAPLPEADTVEQARLADPLFSRIALFPLPKDPKATNPFVGQAKIEDLPQLNDWFQQPEVQQLLSGITLRFEAKPVEGTTDYYNLVALRSHASGEYVGLIEPGVALARNERSEYGDQSVVSLQFDEAATQAWAKMTQKNTGSFIAMVWDEQVYSVPMVREQITGGATMISGNFTRNEAWGLAQMLNSPSLPYRMEIIRYEIE